MPKTDFEKLGPARMPALMKTLEGNFNAARDGNPGVACPLSFDFCVFMYRCWRAGVRPRASNRVSLRINLCISGPCQPVRLHITLLLLAH